MSPQRPLVEPKAGPGAVYPAARCELVGDSFIPGYRVYEIHEHRADDMILSIKRAYPMEIIQGLGEASIWEFVRSEFLGFWHDIYNE
jgi:hypothetical protein